ncbi:hypothetical protein [Legionella waltersii]|uniref:Uncharacterized protein n=1 Tax=Legionella waltersii TaxID=66969 RepID=A0A0W1A150_9GAMM|nr:hypothetical protein [Legionella waltersii]KTD75106.1 hypothetical protein Lwal_3147 [Legionella waltersii]SNV05069.1 Uncharacterised protein [Legionella waltersii]
MVNVTQPTKNQKQEAQEVKRNSTFSSQTEMLEALGKTDEPAVFCAAIANMDLEHDLTHVKEVDILQSTNEEAYKKATTYLEKQISFTENGGDGRHYAFIHTKTPYEVTEFSAKKAKDELTIEDIAKPDNGHALVTFPIQKFEGNPDPYHQVYLNRKNLTECALVDAGRSGGKQTGHCNDLVNKVKDSISDSQDSSRPKKVVVIASDSLRQSSSYTFFPDSPKNNPKNQLPPPPVQETNEQSAENQREESYRKFGSWW